MKIRDIKLKSKLAVRSAAARRALQVHLFRDESSAGRNGVGVYPRVVASHAEEGAQAHRVRAEFHRLVDSCKSYIRADPLLRSALLQYRDRKSLSGHCKREGGISSRRANRRRRAGRSRPVRFRVNKQQKPRARDVTGTGLFNGF